MSFKKTPVEYKILDRDMNEIERMSIQIQTFFTLIGKSNPFQVQIQENEYYVNKIKQLAIYLKGRYGTDIVEVIRQGEI